MVLGKQCYDLTTAVTPPTRTCFSCTSGPSPRSSRNNTHTMRAVGRCARCAAPEVYQTQRNPYSYTHPRCTKHKETHILTHTLMLRSRRPRNDRKFVLATVVENGCALQYASETLRNDRDVVLAAVAENGYALQYASETLRNDRDVVLVAVAENGYALQYLSLIHI